MVALCRYFVFVCVLLRLLVFFGVPRCSLFVRWGSLVFLCVLWCSLVVRVVFSRVFVFVRLLPLVLLSARLRICWSGLASLLGLFWLVGFIWGCAASFGVACGF